MSTFEMALKFGWRPPSGGSPRRLPHLPYNKSAPEFRYSIVIKAGLGIPSFYRTTS